MVAQLAAELVAVLAALVAIALVAAVVAEFVARAAMRWSPSSLRRLVAAPLDLATSPLARPQSAESVG